MIGSRGSGCWEMMFVSHTHCHEHSFFTENNSNVLRSCRCLSISPKIYECIHKLITEYSACIMMKYCNSCLGYPQFFISLPWVSVSFLHFPDFWQPIERWSESVGVSCGFYAQVERATVGEVVKVMTLTVIVLCAESCSSLRPWWKIW